MPAEKITVIADPHYPLNGLLTLPEGLSGPVPGVVFVHGSGASNMDERVGKLTPFKDLAQGLAARGIASVRYDKRSKAHGFKMIRDKSRPVTVGIETIEDAIAAADLLRHDPRIDPDRVFIAGHSMGAMLAPRIDAQGGSFRGLILMAGSPRKLEEIMLDQQDAALAGVPGLLRPLVEKQMNRMRARFAGMYAMTDAEAQKIKMGGGTTLYYFKEMGEHAASRYLEQTAKPMLILQGELDFQATAALDFATYKSLLGDRDNVTFKLYPGLNHAFVPALSGSILKAKQEYNTERHIGPEVIADIANWIRAN